MSNFKRKTVVISGGGEGIGLSIARALGGEGMNVVLADINTDALASAQTELSRLGINVLGLSLDVASEQQWQSVAEHCVNHFGNIHMLVNNAGVGGNLVEIDSYDSADWQWVLDVNLMGVMYGAKTFVPLIKQHGEGGWLLNVASMAGMGGVPYGSAYTASKAAVVAMSESWAPELAGDNIHVAVLCPAFVRTRIHESDRNRQSRYHSNQPASVLQQRAAQSTKQAVEQGIDVDIVGKRVVEALLMKEFYIFTHPDYRSPMQKRAEKVDAAFQRAESSPLLLHVVNQKMPPL